MLTPNNMYLLVKIHSKLQELNLELANVSRNAEMPEIDQASGMITKALTLIKSSLEIKR